MQKHFVRTIFLGCTQNFQTTKRYVVVVSPNFDIGFPWVSFVLISATNILISAFGVVYFSFCPSSKFKNTESYFL